MARWPRRVPTVLGLITLVALTLPGPALAGGFEYPVQGTHALGRGGAFTARADDPSAMYWNPGKLSLLRGTRILYNHNLVDLHLRYARAPQLHEGQVLRWDPVEEQKGFFALGASFFATSDFGLDDWTFGLGFVGPSAIGQASMPGGADAPTRYTFLSKDLVQAYYTATVAWKYEQWFGVGVSLQYVDMIQMKFTQVIEGPDSTGGRPDSNLWDLENTLDMSDRAGFSAIVGAWARPLPFLELGVSARVVPIFIDASGEVGFEGTDNSVLSEADPQRVGASVEFTMPATVQVGVRYIYLDPHDSDREVFDVEVDFVWEQWSALEGYDLDFDDEGVRFRDPDDPSRVLLEFQPQPFRMQRQWQDTYSVRVGGQWNAVPDHLWLRLGGLWESAAVPVSRTLTDFASFDRYGIGAGVSCRFYGVELSVAYAHIFQEHRNVYPDEAAGRTQRLEPDFSGEIIEGPVVNAGRYESSYDVVSIGLEVHFDALIGAATGDGAAEKDDE